MRLLTSSMVMAIVSAGVLLARPAAVAAFEWWTPAAESGHVNDGGYFCVLPHTTQQWVSPDGKWVAWVEGWTTERSDSGPITALTTDEPSESWYYWARLAMSERKPGATRRILATVGPRGQRDPKHLRDLRIVAWSPDSSCVMCEYSEERGLNSNDVRSRAILLAGPATPVRVIRDLDVDRACRASGVELTGLSSWGMFIRGFSDDGRVIAYLYSGGNGPESSRQGYCLLDLVTLRATEVDPDTVTGSSRLPREAGPRPSAR